MKYLKAFFLQVLIVFFANHLLPGIQVIYTTKLPHIRSDILFPICLGFLNSLIYPILTIFGSSVSWIRIFGLAVIVNCMSYAILKVLPVGIQILSLEGYFLVFGVVSIGSFIVNFLEKRHAVHHLPISRVDDSEENPSSSDVSNERSSLMK